MNVFLLMANGDDYHGSYPVRVFTDQEAANKAAKDADKNQVKGCGSDTCDHRYYHTVHPIGLD